MNFTPFGIPFTGTLPVGGTAQFTTGGKFPQGLSGQVVGVLQGSEGGVHYLRPVEAPGSATTAGGQGSAGQQNVANMLPQQTLILPITLPGAKPGDPHQTVHIQVTAGNLQPKYQVTQLPIQAVQQQGGGAVLTVAYNGGQQDGVLLTDGSQGLPEGLTVVAALQPHDLQLLQTGATIQSATGQEGEDTEEKSEEEIKDHNMSQPIALVKTEQLKTEESAEHFVTGSVADYIQRMQNNSLPLSLNQFLKFNAETIKREAQIESSPLSSGGADGSAGDETNSLIVSMEPEGEELNADGTEKPKKKKKYKKKPPKPKKPKPGQVHIATALDGTTLFCCPECNMAYPDKEMLEQHLVGHKIERRFICDICGAGLKRKEHLERHKLGHNPDRPFICSVCMKGFKRKEHLNLHYVIHSGEKTEVCGECGKGFYRKDHLRKHARSHVARRLKEELQARAQQEQNGQVTATGVPTQTNVPPVQHLTIQVSNDAMDAMGISPSNVPTTQIQIPVQIHVPQHNIQVGTTSNVTNGTEGTDDPLSTEQPVSTVVLPTAAETGAMALLHTNTNGNGVQQNQSSQH